jgi:low affinity Fe/Cu permease
VNSQFASFSSFARAVEALAGSPGAFALSVLLVLVWAGTGPFFGFSDTWQLVINTFTTILTFLMVFLIQSTQTRDTQALHLKLDELIRVTEARNALINVEDKSPEELGQIKSEFSEVVDGSVRRRS